MPQPAQIQDAVPEVPVYIGGWTSENPGGQSSEPGRSAQSFAAGPAQLPPLVQVIDPGEAAQKRSSVAQVVATSLEPFGAQLAHGALSQCHDIAEAVMVVTLPYVDVIAAQSSD